MNINTRTFIQIYTCLHRHLVFQSLVDWIKVDVVGVQALVNCVFLGRIGVRAVVNWIRLGIVRVQALVHCIRIDDFRVQALINCIRFDDGWVPALINCVRFDDGWAPALVSCIRFDDGWVPALVSCMRFCGLALSSPLTSNKQDHMGSKKKNRLEISASSKVAGYYPLSLLTLSRQQHRPDPTLHTLRQQLQQ